ncbi:protein PFC0760c-like [Hyperolius riggenbachi]|uniref:protein PFC0760c-like n=1 Tax=Hyperolius riggenbachi TaxID=752182 RepID=UPI0035A2875B
MPVTLRRPTRNCKIRPCGCEADRPKRHTEKKELPAEQPIVGKAKVSNVAEPVKVTEELVTQEEMVILTLVPIENCDSGCHVEKSNDGEVENGKIDIVTQAIAVQSCEEAQAECTQAYIANAGVLQLHTSNIDMEEANNFDDHTLPDPLESQDFNEFSNFRLTIDDFVSEDETEGVLDLSCSASVHQPLVHEESLNVQRNNCNQLSKNRYLKISIDEKADNTNDTRLPLTNVDEHEHDCREISSEDSGEKKGNETELHTEKSISVAYEELKNGYVEDGEDENRHVDNEESEHDNEGGNDCGEDFENGDGYVEDVEELKNGYVEDDEHEHRQGDNDESSNQSEHDNDGGNHCGEDYEEAYGGYVEDVDNEDHNVYSEGYGDDQNMSDEQFHKGESSSSGWERDDRYSVDEEISLTDCSLQNEDDVDKEEETGSHNAEVPCSENEIVSLAIASPVHVQDNPNYQEENSHETDVAMNSNQSSKNRDPKFHHSENLMLCRIVCADYCFLFKRDKNEDVCQKKKVMWKNISEKLKIH